MTAFMRGPVNPSMKSDFGIVVEGNEYTPMIMMGHSPSRYARHLRDALSAFFLPRAEHYEVDLVEPILRQFAATSTMLSQAKSAS